MIVRVSCFFLLGCIKIIHCWHFKVLWTHCNNALLLAYSISLTPTFFRILGLDIYTHRITENSVGGFHLFPLSNGIPPEIPWGQLCYLKGTCIHVTWQFLYWISWNHTGSRYIWVIFLFQLANIIWVWDTVDGWNPAPPGMYKTL